MAFGFLNDAGSVVLGAATELASRRWTLAQNIAYQALIGGHTVLFTSAGQLLGGLLTNRPELIEHAVTTLVGQRVFGLTLGYEDLNDHDELRHGTIMAAGRGAI